MALKFADVPKGFEKHVAYCAEGFVIIVSKDEWSCDLLNGVFDVLLIGHNRYSVRVIHVML